MHSRCTTGRDSEPIPTSDSWIVRRYISISFFLSRCGGNWVQSCYKLVCVTQKHTRTQVIYTHAIEPWSIVYRNQSYIKAALSISLIYDVMRCNGRCWIFAYHHNYHLSLDYLIGKDFPYFHNWHDLQWLDLIKHNPISILNKCLLSPDYCILSIIYMYAKLWILCRIVIAEDW